MARDAVAAITDDHRRIERLLERLATGVSNPMSLLDEIEVRLTAHNRAEEDHVYPAILGSEPDEPGEVYHGYEAHHKATALLYRLKSMDPRSHDFRSTAREFVEVVKNHVDEEETTILPKMIEGVDKRLLSKVGREFDRRRLSELAARGIPGDGRVAGNGKRRSGRTTGPSAEGRPDGKADGKPDGTPRPSTIGPAARAGFPLRGS